VAKRTQRVETRRPAQERVRKKPKRRARAQRSAILLRWCVIGAVCFVAFLYYRPLSSYVETRSTLNARQAEVSELRAEKARLQARLERSTTLATLTREARRLSLVRPGERLYVVKGIAEWRRAQRARAAGKATIGRDG
jgi:cell division protein FtsB